MYYVFVGVSILVALTMIVPSCSAGFSGQPQSAPPPASAV
jgi:hypothetical protein